MRTVKMDKAYGVIKRLFGERKTKTMSTVGKM